MHHTNDSNQFTREGLLTLIDALPTAISVIDGSRRIVLANKAMFRFVNGRQKELIGSVGGEALGCINADAAPRGCGFGPECLRCKLRETVEITLQRKKPHRMLETTMAFEALGERHLRLSTLPVMMDNREMVLVAIEDITEIRMFEKTLLEKEKLSAVLETAGAVCHEFNQPLQVISGYGSLLEAQKNLDEETLEIIRTIAHQIEKMGELNRKLMSITKYRTKSYLKSKILDIDESVAPGPDNAFSRHDPPDPVSRKK